MSDQIEKVQEIKQEQPQVQLDQLHEQNHESSIPQKREQQGASNIEQKDRLIMKKYKLGQEIGNGAGGKVHKVKDELGNDLENLVIKMINMQQKQKQSVENEIQLLKKNQSQYVVRLQGTEYNQEKKKFYILMEKCESSLFQIYDSDISDDQRTEYAYDLIKGVAFIHSQNICHRDLKLQNILLKENQIKIADFGVSKSIEKQLKSFQGTLQYMAPQFYTKKVYTQKVDSWALGVILLEIFCRKRIIELSPERFAGLIQQFPSQKILNEVKNKFIRKIIKNFLEKQEEKRWSIKEVAEKIIKKEKKGKRIEQSQQQQIYLYEETRQKIQI